MSQRHSITDAREFAEQIWITDECRALAEQYPKLSDFWKYCDRSDCMLAFLDSTGYQNPDLVWKFFETIREEEKRLAGDDDLDEWRENLHRYIEERTRSEIELEEKGQAIPGYARRALWSTAFIYTFHYAREAIQSARSRAGLEAGINSAVQGKTSKEEIHAAWDAAAHQAFIETMKKQADLLRKILGNPFHRMSNEDFAL